MEEKMQQTERIISPPGRTCSKIIAFVLAIASFSLTVVLPSHAEEKINIKVDYVAKLNELAKAGRPEELNAAPYYKKAFELFVKQPEQLKKINRRIWPDDLTAEQREVLQTWVRQSSKALTQLKKGTQKPHYWPEYRGTSMMGIVLPELWKARALAIVFCSRAKLNAAKGNFKQAFSDLLVCYRFGAHFTGPKTLVEQLVGIGIRTLAADAAFQILDKQQPASDLLKYFQLQLETLLLQNTFVIDFTSEKFFICDSIRIMFTDDGKGGGPIKQSEVKAIVRQYQQQGQLSPQEIEELKRRWGKLERQQTTLLADKVYEYYGKVVHKTPWQLRNEGIILEIEKMTNNNALLHVLAPNVSRVLEVSSRGKADTEALITTLAFLRYKADKGLFLRKLDELLSSGYLKNLPTDPYSDKSLVYKRTKDNFVLYSLGADFDDDGGIPSKWGEGEKGGDQVFWPVQPPEKQKK